MTDRTEDQKNNTIKRDILNDIVRIVAMLLVIGVHWFGSMAEYCPQTGAFPAVMDFLDKLTRLGVPLFFALSGYYILGKEIKDTKAFYYKRFVRVIVPYLIYAAIYVVYFTVFEECRPTMMLKNYIVNVLTGNVHGTHWFVYSIIGLYFATPFLSRMFRTLSDREVMFLYLAAVSFGLLDAIFGLFGYGFGINTYVFEGTLLTFMSGYCTQRCLDAIGTDRWKHTGLYRILIITALFIIYCFTEWGILLTLTAGISVAGNNRYASDNKISVVTGFLSRYSYSVYLIHAAVVSAVLHIYTGWGGARFGMQTVAGYIVVFLFSLAFVIVFDLLCTDRIIKSLSRRKT